MASLIALAACAVGVSAADGAVGARASGAAPNLTFLGCIGDQRGCTKTTGASGALDSAQAVLVTPGGQQVYTVDSGESTAISHFTVDRTGHVSFFGCVGDVGGCRPTNPDALGGGNASGIAVTPDGKQLYVAVSDDISHFSIGDGGRLTFAGCFGPAGGCTPVPFSNATTGVTPLTGLTSVTIGPNGRGLYAAAAYTYQGPSGTSVTADALSHFTLDGAGNLGFTSCVGDLKGCTATKPAHVLQSVASLTVSPDDGQLYAASKNSVSHLTLDASGSPTFAGCIGDFAGCVPTNPVGALNGASALAVSHDGTELFAAGSDANAVSRLSLHAAGVPAFRDCVGDQAGCTATRPGGALQGASALALTPDGKSLYVASNAGNTVSELTLDSSGAVAFAACIGNRGGVRLDEPR